MQAVREGIIYRGGRCYSVVRLFDECTPRREKNFSKSYRPISEW